MKNLVKIITFVLLISFGVLIFRPVNLTLEASGNLCDFLPCDQAGFCADGSCADALTSTSTYVRWGFTLVFVGIIILGVVMIIRAALKIIRSEGDDKKVQEGAETLKGVFFGVIIIFIGIIGIVIIAALFNATNIFNQNPEVPTDGSGPLINIPIVD